MLLGFGYLYKFIFYYYYFFQKAENSRLKKKPVGQSFVIFFCFCLKQGRLGPQTNKLTWSCLNNGQLWIVTSIRKLLNEFTGSFLYLHIDRTLKDATKNFRASHQRNCKSIFRRMQSFHYCPIQLFFVILMFI